MITSKDNARIKHIKRLMDKAKVRREEGLFVLEGRKAVTEACRQGLACEIYLSEELIGETVPDEDRLFEVWTEISGLSPDVGRNNCPVMETLSTELFRQLSDTVTPQGVLAVVRMPEYDSEEIFQKEDCKIICLEDVRDPGNIGTIIRTAEGARIDAVVLSRGCADVYQPKVTRATMGSVLRVPCLSAETLPSGQEERSGDEHGGDGFPDAMRYLKSSRFSLYAAHLQGAVDYREPSYDGRVGILIGNEANGLSNEAAELADVKVKIPMKGELESLNAAVSAALLMYEVERNRESI